MDNPFQCYRNLWVRNLNRKPGMRGGWTAVNGGLYSGSSHNEKLQKCSFFIHLVLFALLILFVKGGMHFPVLYEKNGKQFTFA